MTLRPAVFLDRDGVLSRSLLREGKPMAPRTVDEFELLPGVVEAAQQLHAAGYALVVVTNQPDVRTGKAQREAVEEIHRRMRQRLPLDDVKVCYHVDSDQCSCRKPKAGMLLEAAREHGLDLTKSWMVGDRWRDVAAGKAAGCRTVLIECHYDEKAADAPDYTVASMTQAADVILQNRIN